MDYIVREAVIADRDQLSELLWELDRMHVDGVPEFFRGLDAPASFLEYIDKAIQSEDAIVLAAECGGQIVGAIRAASSEGPDSPGMVRRKFTHIESVCIKSEFRGLGIGRALMSKVEEWSLQLGCDDCQLNVWEFNGKAIEFYRELGYETANRGMWKRLK